MSDDPTSSPVFAVHAETSRRKTYWKKNLLLTGALLVVWFVVTFVAGYNARALNEFIFLGFPLGFYMGAQGALVVYVVIIGIYARMMDRIDDEYRDAGRDKPQT